ncbi:unnamed protein product [marine sediment metagenome]|uniref:Ribbon-helix-helix protein CopG domain-containing protein n=1 Tax=marine sediment metagenome TaxID=412755 RepID=X1VH03_9ZZZZ
MLTIEKIKEYKADRRLNSYINFTINKKEKEKLKDLAKKKGISMSELLRMLISECMKEEIIKQKRNGDI